MELDTYHYHETLDRTAMIRDAIDNSVVDHPVYDSAPKEVQELIIKAQDLLYAYYVWVCEQQDNF